ncbi:uncharacterized protein LOC120279462 isoform X2 [Dioscorea cayenensis subsp. rotundata]|uniref:Uncharacterized protein LOC120279462 isoform X2 n=1 Tax=Dioscorea cayennensis subsp. rotundata TaxID=55577 RepID=A0AB40CQK4_DIOCR|nr:uncharacterized protein LOC120279462 isoform X2 [Dioscorea cayenensis subsp. rotundata]
MFLKKREFWGGRARGPAPPELPPPPDEASAAATEASSELASSLENRRLYREVTLALRTALRDATAEFSFLRLRGLRNLLKSLRSIADSDDAIRLFRQSQSLHELQVIPVLFNNSLRQLKDEPVMRVDHIFGVEPMKITSPATDSEVALALRVLEGCCLLHKESTVLAHEHDAIKVLVNILSTRGTLEQGACLDALISLMLDSVANQMDFEGCYGIEKIAELVKDEEGDDNIRLKCGEFLLLLAGQVKRRERAPLATIHEDIRKLLGEKCASLVWAVGQFGSTLAPEDRQVALQIQARRVLESLTLH